MAKRSGERPKGGRGNDGRGGKGKEAWTPALALAERLAAKGPSACYLLEGGERFLVDAALAALRAHVLGDNPGPSLCELEGGKVELAVVLDELRTLPFFGTSGRLVIVDGASAGGQTSFVATHGEAIAAYLEAPNPSSTLALVVEKLDSRLRSTKALLAKAERVDCRPPDEAGLRAFVRARAQAWGRPFARGADQALLDRLGGQAVALAAIDAEVRKLAAAGGEGPITAEQVEALASFGSSEQGFNLVDRIARGDVEGALRVAHRVFRDGLITGGGARTRDATGIAMILLPTLRWDLNRLIQARGMLEAGARLYDITQELRVHYKDKSTFQGRVRRARLDELARRHALLRRADGALRSSADPQGTLSDVVVALALAEREPVSAR